MRGAVLLDPPAIGWACSGCPAEHVTRLAQPHSPMHHCAGQAGLLVPYVRAAQVATTRLVRVERQDYVGDELVARDADGRVAMTVRTEHADGRVDATVYAPTARATIGA